jgi:hypothetical protein
MSTAEIINDDNSMRAATEGYARMEKSSLAAVRQTRGEVAWAECIGSTYISNLNLLQNIELKNLGIAVLNVLAGDLVELQTRPDLAVYFIKGVERELRDRRLIKDEESK